MRVFPRCAARPSRRACAHARGTARSRRKLNRIAPRHRQAARGTSSITYRQPATPHAPPLAHPARKVTRVMPEPPSFRCDFYCEFSGTLAFHFRTWYVAGVNGIRRCGIISRRGRAQRCRCSWTRLPRHRRFRLSHSLHHFRRLPCMCTFKATPRRVGCCR